MPEAERFKAFEQSLTDIQYIKDLRYGTEVLVASSAKALAAIVRQLPETEPQLLEQAVTTSNQTVRSNWLLVLPAFLSRYPEERRSRVLEWALANLQTTRSVHQKIDILNTISPFLSGTEPYLLQKAVTIAQDIQNIPQDIQNNVIPQLALAVIAPRLPETQHLEIVEQALVVADNIADAKSQAEALAKIAPQLLSKKRFKEVSKWALTAAQNISDPESRVKVLVKIAPQLTEIDRFDALEQSLNTIQNIKTDKELTETLSLIISQLPSPKTQLLQQVLATAQGIKDPEHSVSALVEIAAIVPETEPQLLQQILTTARSIKDERYFPQALALIAHRLPETQRFDIWEQASTAAHNIKDDRNRARTLAAIVPSLPEIQRFDAYSQALTAAQKISEPKSRAKTLREIARNLPDNEPKLFQQALSAAQEIEEVVGYSEESPLMLWSLEQDVGRGHILDSLVFKLSEAELHLKTKPHLLIQALTAIQNLQNEPSRAYILDKLVPQLPQTYLPQLLETIWLLSKKNIIKLLTTTATYLPEALAAQCPSDKHSVALEIVKALPQDANKIKFLSALAPRLSMGLLPNALRLIQDAFTQDADRAEALSNLVPYLPIEQLPEAFRLITKSIKTPRHQTTAIENLIPFLSFQGFQDVLNLIEEHGITQLEDKPTTESKTKAITEPKLQARILRKAATALGAGQVGAGLSQLPPSIESEGFLTPQVQEQVESSLLIDKIIHLTEQLKPYQRNDFSYEKEAADILSQLAPALAYLPNVLQNKVSEHVLQFLQSVQQFKDLGYSAQLLSAFTPYFPEAADPFLANCSGDDYRALLNIRIRVAVPGKLDTQVLNETFKAIEGQYRKAEALVEIACHPAGSNYQTETLRTIRKLSNTYRKAQYLQRLTPHLLDNQRLETANIIREITNPYHKVKALVALACKFPEFRTEVRTAAQALGNRVQRIEQLSTLAVEVPEILPDILDLAEKVDQPIERKEILLALAPHLPMRINREVNRERPAGRPSIEDQDLWNRSLYLLARGYRDALQGGSLRNETAQDKDFLNLQDEINALSDLLLMRDLEPPMTVGILGGWGGGKSYIMHLMQAHLTKVRSRLIAKAEAWNPDPNHEKLSPYVGHIYQIKFDAWTFAKSDLWASLMQTIFFELDRQLTLETQITTILNGIPELEKRRDLESKIWAVLYKTSDVDRQWFLERVLTDKALLNQLSGQNQGETTGQLWKTLNNTQQEAIEQLKKTQQQLEIARRELDTKKSTIRTQINDQFAPLLKINDLKQKQNFKQVDALLGTSFILLRQRIGPRLFKHFHNEIHQELYGEESNSSKSGKRVGLWQELSQTLEQLEQARKELALAATELQPSQPSIGNSTTSPSNVASLSNTESSAETSAEPSSDEAAEQPKPTQEEVQQKIDALFQKAEGLKLDIQTVAASVIEQQYWQVNWVSGWQWVKKNWLVLLLFLGFFISPLLLLKFFQINPIEIGTATIEQILTRIVAILAPTLPALVTLQSLLRSSHKWFEETQLALHEYEKSVENRNKQLEDTIETTIQKRLQEDSELQQLERNVRQLETQVEQQQHALPVNEYASLNDFVNDRLSSKTYANRLGLMQQVKEDLFDLSNKLLPPSGQSLESKINFLQDTFPRGPARVVVYIDDLDRCPPDRVVQVLEAVQLLVKTPLFIAVLAVDERYITRALEKFYEGVLSRRGRPSGTDYLEKIIQLPYRVRPIMANNLESYLRSQVVIQDSATGGAKFSEFSRQEFNMLLACCQQVDLSPRTLKRLTNVYKLFKIVCRTRGTKPSPQAQQAILALLALSGRYPSLMRGIFDSIETCFEEQRTAEKAEQRTAEKAEKTLRTLYLRSPLKDFFKYYQLPEGDRYLQREFEKLKHDALQTEILPRTLTLEDMTHEIFNLIRSFSFVGEIGEDPEDYRIGEPMVDDRSS